MKNRGFILTIFATVFAIVGAFSNAKKVVTLTTVKYTTINKVLPKVYIGKNITGLIEGIDFVCVIPPSDKICYIVVDAADIQHDANGPYVLESDIIFIKIGQYTE